MKCKITRNAAKMIAKSLAEGEGRKVRVYVTHAHGDHAHYELELDDPKETDEIVMTDKGIEVLLDKNDPWLDGVKIDYLYFPQEGFVITNPSRGNHGHH